MRSNNNFFETTENATNVRKKWGKYIDSVIRDRPLIVKRNRDKVVMGSLEFISSLLEVYNFSVEYISEEDGSITAELQEIDLIVNAENKEKAKKKLAGDILEYANEYYSEFSFWHSSSNRKNHLPYVMKILLINDIDSIINTIVEK